MPQSSRMIVTPWACCSQPATSLSAAARGMVEAEANTTMRSTSFFMRRIVP